MQNQPLVSIITATYNHERFIGQCIESVLAQTYHNWEQIIIDDGSTDRTSEIVAQYKKDERIKYIRQNNVGIWRLGETYNKALKISEGELIAVLEGDDFWPPWKLEKEIPVFHEEEVTLSWGKCAVVNSEGKVIAISPGTVKPFRNKPKEEILRKLLLRNFIPPCTAMCRKDALFSIGGFQQHDRVPYVDYPTWLELSLIGEIRPVDEILGYWRRHGGQVSSTVVLEITDGRNICLIKVVEHLPQELKNSLGITANDLSKRCQHNIALSRFALGRIHLARGEWGEARVNLKQALEKGTLSAKMKALLGIVCSYLRLDLEWAVFLVGRSRLGGFD